MGNQVPKEDISPKLVTDMVKIGTDEAQTTHFEGKPFPLVLSPVNEKMNFIQLQEYMMAHNQEILIAAAQYGAVMFSGFEIKTGEEWASILFKTGLKEMEYIGGAAVRKLVVGSDNRMDNVQILTTNESPPSEPIPFHHELAQTPDSPDHICFYCSVNDAEGGSTPLIRSDLVYNWLNENYPEFTQEIEEKGVKYVKVAPEEDDAESALGRSWKSMYNVHTKEAAEIAAAEQGSTLEWIGGYFGPQDCKITSKMLPAVKQCTNGNKVFFNQVIAAYTGWVDKRNNLKEGVIFADGTPLPDEVMMALSKYMDDHACTYRWTPGKFVIVDNSVTYHSRQPFNGYRKVYAAISKGQKPMEDKTTHLVLNSGDKMPSLGLGLWKIPKDQCADAVYKSIESGYRLLDSACDYGNEQETGEGIKNALYYNLCKREDLFVVSKLWNTFHKPEHVELACRKSMADLGVDYLDLYLIHFPIAQKFVPIEDCYPPEWTTCDTPTGAPAMILDPTVSYQDTWKAMEDLVEKGLVRNIGFCNIGTTMIRQVLSYCKVKPAVL